MRPVFVLLFVVRSWLAHLGGFGLIILALADNSLVPMPGSMDALTLILSAHKKELWPYYAAMATLGSVIGGYITYGIGKKGGEEALDKRLTQKRAEKVRQKFHKFGFGAVAVPAVLPPPVPIVPFLLTAGAMQYPPKKFVAALAVGRAVRYSVIAFLGATFGRHILRFFARYYRPALYGLICLAVVGAIVALALWYKHRHVIAQEAAAAKQENAEEKAAQYH